MPLKLCWSLLHPLRSSGWQDDSVRVAGLVLVVRGLEGARAASAMVRAVVR